jgi:hypothetical protein
MELNLNIFGKLQILPRVISEKESANPDTLHQVIAIMQDLDGLFKKNQHRSPAKQAMISNIMFMNIINFNVRIKKLDTHKEIEYGKLFKKAISEPEVAHPFNIFEFVVNQNFDLHFSGHYVIDWNRYYRFCNRIDLFAVYFEDPITRNRIREYNKQFFRRDEDKDFFKSVFISTVKDKNLQPEIFLVLLELGLLSFGEVIEYGLIKNLKFEERLKLPYLKILLHLMVLLNDENFFSSASDKGFYFSNDPIMNMIMEVLDKMNDEIDQKSEEEFTQYINMLLISFFNPPFCFYSRSVKTLEKNNEFLLKDAGYHTVRGFLPQVREFIDQIEDIMIQILQKYYTVTISEVSPDLSKKLISLFNRLSEQITDKRFRQEFAIAGGCYTILSLLHIFTSSADLRTDLSGVSIIGEGLELLSRMCDESGIAASQIFKARSFKIIRRLAWFNLRDVSLLLMNACKKAPWILENSAENLHRLTEIFNSSFTDLMAYIDEFEEENSAFRKRTIRSLTVLCYALKEMILAVSDLHVRQTMQLTFQEALLEHTNKAIKFSLDGQKNNILNQVSKHILTLNDSDKEIELIGLEWDYFEMYARKQILDSTSGYQVMAQLHYFVLVLFNCCVIGIEAPGIKSQLKELFLARSSEQSLEELNVLKGMPESTRTYFLIQIVNIYCNCILLESDIKMENTAAEPAKPILRRNSLQNAIMPKMSGKTVNPQSGNESMLMFQKGQEDILALLGIFGEFESRSKKANKDLMYRCLLRFMMKYFKGVMYEKEKFQQQPFMNLHKVLDAFINKRELILRLCDVNSSSSLFQNAILFMTVKENVQREDSSKENKIVDQFISLLELLYKEQPDFESETKGFEREELSTLQTRNSSLFATLSTMGSISMSKFIKSMKEAEMEKSTKINLFGEEIEEKSKYFKGKELPIKSAISRYRVSKSLSLNSKGDKAKTTLLLSTLSEGTDISKDIFFRNILMWLMKSFSKTLQKFETSYKVKSTASAHRRKDLKQRSTHKPAKTTKTTQDSVRSIKFGQTFIKDPLVPQLVTVISNILNCGLRPRDIFLETFFSKEKADPETTEEENKKAREEEMKELKRGLITLLVESAISMQRKIKKRLFTKNIITVCEDYFLACLTIKDIVKGNMIPIKKYIGKECFFSNEVDQERNVVQELFSGLIYDKNEQNRNSLVLNSNDRVDLAYYNIITLTMLTELVSGPCKENQDSVGDGFINVFVLLEKTNQNIKSQLYKVQEAMVLFLVGLLEEGNSNNCGKLSTNIPPAKIYAIICKHVRHLCENTELTGNDSSIGKVIKQELLKTDFKNCGGLTQKLREHYRLNPHFSNHPSITIAVRLYFLMREIIAGNYSKRYERYLKEREAQNELEEYNIENMIENNTYSKAGLELEKRKNTATSGFMAKAFLINKQNKIYPNNLDPLVTEADKMDTAAMKRQQLQMKNSNLLKEISIFEFVKGITSTVEILHQTGETSTNLQIYFPRLPSTFNFKDEQKYSFIQNSSIKDSNSKVLDLMNFVSEFQIEMDREKKRWSPWFKRMMDDDVVSWYMIFLCLLGLAINSAYLFNYQLRGGPRFTSYTVMIIVEILRYVILGSSGLGLLLWMIFKYPVKVQKVRDRVVSKVYLERRKASYQALRKFFRIYILDTLCDDLFAATSIVHLIACLLSMNVSEVFISLHLYTLMAFSRTTRYVIKSITEHIDQLMMTLLLTVICVYFYAILVAHFFGNYVSDPNTDMDFDRDECASLGSCFFYSMKTGLTNGDGVGIMIKPVQQQSALFIPRLLINLTFFILLNLAAMNIIFGIILDTFAELRAFQEARDYDCNNICFICGFERKNFEKDDKDFEEHRLHEHNLWDYVYYLIYLKSKDPLEYTGLEYYVNEKFTHRNTNWFPIQRTKYLGDSKKDEGDINVAVQECEDEVRNLRFYVSGIQKLFACINAHEVTPHSIRTKDGGVEGDKDQVAIEDGLWRTIGEENISEIRQKALKEVDKMEANITRHCYEESHMVSVLYKNILLLDNLCN